jgi:hypothetical protein
MKLSDLVRELTAELPAQIRDRSMGRDSKFNAATLRQREQPEPIAVTFAVLGCDVADRGHVESQALGGHQQVNGT